MALQVLATNTIGNAVAANLGTTDDLMITASAVVANTAGVAVSGTGITHLVRVEGTLIGIRAIDLTATNFTNNMILISETGSIKGFGGFSAIRLVSGEGELDNRGTIWGETGCVLWGGDATVGLTSTLTNSGTMESLGTAINRGSLSADTFTLNNSGLIKSSSFAYFDISSAPAIITNTGRIEGRLFFGSGNDTYNGTGGRINDIIDGASGDDTLRGGIDNDRFRGGAGADLLDGGLGADILEGGADNDVYVVDNAGDVTTELAAGGTDRVDASVSFSLAAEVENLTLIGTAAINGTGNGLANILIGNSGANVLDGGAGADTMTGAAGNDTYVVDNAGDVVAELASGGTDTVNSSISLVLFAEVENLVLTGSALNGTGNGLANRITGTSAANLLDGGVGADVMTGAGGNDTYVVDNAGDVVVEALSGGTDTVNASVSVILSGNVETLVLTGASAINGTGNALANTMTGNGAANVLSGAAGNDILQAGGGNDRLIGGLGIDQLFGGFGADRFEFAALAESTAAARDTIGDFSRSQADRIVLTGIDANTTASGNQAFIFKGLTGFTHQAGELIYGFSGTTTIISGDVNGDGIADFSVRLSNKVSLIASDFLL